MFPSNCHRNDSSLCSLFGQLGSLPEEVLQTIASYLRQNCYLRKSIPPVCSNLQRRKQVIHILRVLKLAPFNDLCMTDASEVGKILGGVFSDYFFAPKLFERSLARYDVVDCQAQTEEIHLNCRVLLQGLMVIGSHVANIPLGFASLLFSNLKLQRAVFSVMRRMCNWRAVQR
jgi:hypothetical protein